MTSDAGTVEKQVFNLTWFDPNQAAINGKMASLWLIIPPLVLEKELKRHIVCEFV
jgi:hypothetical protein